MSIVLYFGANFAVEMTWLCLALLLRMASSSGHERAGLSGCGAWGFHCGGFFDRSRGPGTQDSVAVAHRS